MTVGSALMILNMTMLLVNATVSTVQSCIIMRAVSGDKNAKEV